MCQTKEQNDSDLTGSEHSNMKKKYVYNYPTIICECGGKYNKNTKKTHDKSKRHRNFMGEECPRKERVKMPEKEKNRDSISFIMNNKVENLTEEEHIRRKEYVKIKMRECRARKKQLSEKQ